jgi:hypothetical protein
VTKLGPHILYGTQRARAWAATAPLVKVIDDPETLRETAKYGQIRIFRHYFPEQDIERPGKYVALDVLDALGDAHATHIELFNETAQRLGEGLERHVELTREAGTYLAGARPDLTLVGFSFSTGQPQDEDWLWLQGQDYGDVPVIGLHEYWGPGLTSNRTRHRYLHTLLKHQHPPFLITECGRDAAGPTRLGWRDQDVPASQYTQELASFAAEIEPLDYVLGATVFTAGANYGGGPMPWDSFDCDELDPAELTRPKSTGGAVMAVNAEIQKRIDEAAAAGVNVGQVYKVKNTTTTQTAYTDAGVFQTEKGVPGAYFFPDAEAKPPFG